MNVKARSEDSIGRRPDVVLTSSRAAVGVSGPGACAAVSAPRLRPVAGTRLNLAAQRLPASSDLTEQPEARFFASRLLSEAGAFLGARGAPASLHRVSRCAVGCLMGGRGVHRWELGSWPGQGHLNSGPGVPSAWWMPEQPLPQGGCWVLCLVLGWPAGDIRSPPGCRAALCSLLASGL